VNLLVRFLRRCCPDGNYKLLTACLANETDKSWSRPLVIDSFYSCFASLRTRNPDSYKELADSVMTLKVSILNGKEKEPRVPLDECLLLAINFSTREKKSAEKPLDPTVLILAVAKLKRMLVRFALKTCALRQAQMKASRRLFVEWDKKLHTPATLTLTEEREEEGEDGEGGEKERKTEGGDAMEPALAGIYGSFSFDEFSEM